MQLDGTSHYTQNGGLLSRRLILRIANYCLLIA
jgi:hypothetical protein